MTTAFLNILAQVTPERLSNAAWVMFAFGCIFLYGGLIFGIVRAIRGKLPYPQHVLEKAADVGWLVALGTLATVAYLARQLRGGEHELHILWWIVLYVAVCVPLAILCRHLVILHHRLTQRREEAQETGIGGTTD
ncbi:MAG: hypothetical protein AMK75_01910 [Planctomycetes bacterium SM23_65]|nr:MAG: hypothetical protein AMK75_01910 [Planctomycetes bacterium SM23_65]